VREDLQRDNVLDLLSHLVDKSLVLVAEQDGETRYRLLETVRQTAGRSSRSLARKGNSGSSTQDVTWRWRKRLSQS
jgi:predicted transcriptional regulator